MDISYNLKTVAKCIRYLHRHPEAWEELRISDRQCWEGGGYDPIGCCGGCLTDGLLSPDDISERYNDWVEHYYQLDEEIQNRFSEYWFPLGKDPLSDLSFIDLLMPYLPVIVLSGAPFYNRMCICRSLTGLVENHKRENRFYWKLFMKKRQYSSDYL